MGRAAWLVVLGLLVAAGAAGPGARAAPLPIAVVRFQLANGLTVLLHEDHRVPTVAVSLWVRVAPEVPMDAWTERCAARGVVFYPGRLYDVQHRPLPRLCLGFAAHDVGEQNEACLRMAQALKDVRGKA